MSNLTKKSSELNNRQSVFHSAVINKTKSISPVSNSKAPENSNLNFVGVADVKKQSSENHSLIPTKIRKNVVDLKKKDVMRLSPGEFLCDQLILYFVTYYDALYSNSNVHVLSSFFYFKLALLLKSKSDLNPLLKWHKKIDLFKFPVIIIPINEDNHWYFIIITNIQDLKNCVEHYEENDLPFVASQIIIVDSLYKDVRDSVKKNIIQYLSFLLNSSNDIVKEYVEMIVGNSPLQKNGYDCGIYVIYGIKMILKDNLIIRSMLHNEPKSWWGPLMTRQELLNIIKSQPEAFIGVVPNNSDYNDNDLIVLKKETRNDRN